MLEPRSSLGEPSEDPLSLQAVVDELERILASADFDASDRNRAFLRYVVEETLAGKADRIKGYSIAQSVFKRDTDFDPQLDPVVRIEASRLRRSMERYYLKAGRGDPIHINLPKGGYIPTFAAKVTPPLVQAALTALRSDGGVQLPFVNVGHPSVSIIPFKDLDGDPNHDVFARGITEELGVALTRFSDLRVLAAPGSLQMLPFSGASQEDHRSSANFVLQGGIRTLAGGIRITAQLLSTPDGTYIWAASFDRALKPDDWVRIETEVAGTIAARIAAPHGAVARYLARDRAGGATDHSASGPLIRSYLYRRNRTQELGKEIRDTLNATAGATLDDADSWAQLAYVYADGYQHDPAEVANRASLLDLALAAAQRAVELDSQSAFAHLALSTAFYFRQELERAHQEGYRALELNPYNPEVLTQVGWRRAVPGNWDEGMLLFRRGVELHPDPPDWFRLVLALDAYRRGDLCAATKEVRNGALVPIPIAYLLVAAIVADCGEATEAREVCEAGRAAFPSVFGDPGAHLRLYNMDTAVAERLLTSLCRSKLIAS